MEKNMKENSIITNKMAMEFIYGQLDKNMMDNGLMTKDKAKEY